MPKTRKDSGATSLAGKGIFKNEKKKETKDEKSEHYSNYTTFVLAPTLPEYPKADISDLNLQFDELKKMAEKDIFYLSSPHPKLTIIYPKVIFTGYSGSESDKSKLAECISALAESEMKEINFVITAHGSPGQKGRFGMGWDDDAHTNYRIDAAEFISLLEKNGIEKLKEKSIHFSFRCCNSAYVPINRFEKSDDVIKKDILEKSCIGEFYRVMQERGYKQISVTGFRGYYFPGIKAVELGDKRKKYDVKDGTITIQADGTVLIPERNKLVKIQTPKLDEEFKVEISRKHKKKV